MTQDRADQIVNDYFEQLRKALLPMPRLRRDQLLDELRAHVEAARDGAPADSEAAAREVLERLGDPEDIVGPGALGGPRAPKGLDRVRPALERAGGRRPGRVDRRPRPLPGPPRVDAHELFGSGPQRAVVAVGGYPTGIAVDSGHQTVYVAAGETNNLSMFAEASCNATTTTGCADPRSVPTGGQDPIGVAADPSTSTLYVVNGGSNTLAVIGTNNCNGTDHSGCSASPTLVPVAGGPEFLALNSATQTVYTADTNSGTVSVLDAETCNARSTSGCTRTLGSVLVGAGAFPIAVDQATNTVYVGTNQGVAVIDGVTCEGSDMSGCAKQPVTIPLSNVPAGIAVDDAQHTLYVSGESGTVAVIDTSSCNATDTKGCAATPTMVRVGADARGATFDAATSTLYVANADSDTVSMVDTNHCNASTTSGCAKLPPPVPVGSSPRRIAIGDPSGTAYVVNVLGNNVSLLSTQSCNATDAAGCPSANPAGTSGAGGAAGGGAEVGVGSSASAGSAGSAGGQRAPTRIRPARRPPGRSLRPPPARRRPPRPRRGRSLRVGPSRG